MSLIINTLITFIGIAIFIIAIYNYLPVIEKILAEKLKISLFGKSKDHGALGQIFYKYNQKNVGDWVKWAETLDAAEHEQAIELLKAHIEGSPASWGAVTPEAIKALGLFENREHITVLKGVLSTAKKIWKKYVTAESCYEAACRSIIYINPESAKNILAEELGTKLKDTGERVNCIINTLADFPEETDINPIFTKILISSDESFNTRNHAITIAQTRSEELAYGAFFDALGDFVNAELRPFTADDLKIYELLLNLVTHKVDDKVFDLLITACKSPLLGKTTVKTLELVLKSGYEQFSPKQLYMLINLKVDDLGILANALGSAFNLNSMEKLLCMYRDPMKLYPLEKTSVALEHLTKGMEVPEILRENYEKLKNILKDRAVAKQHGEHGGVVLTGFAEKEKQFLSRAMAAEKRWSFIYVSYEDIVSSGTISKQLIDLLATHKPCVLYFESINQLLNDTENVFAKNLKNFAADPMIFLLASIAEEADIDEQGTCVLFNKTDELKGLFPQAFEISSYKDFQKNTILMNKLANLEMGREQDHFEKFNILKPTNDMSPFEFEVFLAKYFRASLLVHGKLIDIGEFEKLDGLDFPERGDL